MQIDPAKRFSNRIENYIKYRPGYPDEVISCLNDECSLSQNAVVAAIGPGMGIFTALLLKRGYTVYAVEPNAAMEPAAVLQLSGNEKFIPVTASAEATTLTEKSINLIVCAQAFHWFNNGNIHREFKRILKDDGYAALIWNNRQTEADQFSQAYENLLNAHTKEYAQVNHRNITENDLRAFFRNGEYKTAYYPNVQTFDESGFQGRAFSSSYIPVENSGEAEKFRIFLKDIFKDFNNAGKVQFHYRTEIYLGRI